MADAECPGMSVHRLAALRDLAGSPSSKATEHEPEALWKLPWSDLCALLHTREGGLSTEEAEKRLAEMGPNETSRVAGRGLAAALRSFFGNVLVLMLVVAAAVAAAVGQVIDSSIIIAMVLLGGALNFLQTFRSQRAVARLRQQLAPTATTLRDGRWSELPRRQLVPGDIIRLSAGDLVPADARLFEARDLYLQQAVLTGESFPAEKEAVAPTSDRLIEEHCIVLFGTSVVSGTGTALVFATGRRTAFGQVIASLAARPPETEFERGMRRFGFLIMQTVFCLILFVFLAAASLGRNPLESLLFAIALAVGLTPEFLPMITTVTLSKGAVRMARERVVVKNLAAIQNFGSIDVLCSDKTGTLTSGKMALSQCLDPTGRASERPLNLAHLNSFFETGVKSPLDEAILQGVAGAAVKLLPEYDPDNSHKIDEIPFDFNRRRLSVVIEQSGKRTLISKGAPEGILSCCKEMEVDAKRQPITPALRARCDAVFHELSSSGFRVLAVAYATVPARSTYRAKDERELTLAGFLAFIDPPLEGVAEALRDLKSDGVEVKILTGDNELVASYVCNQVGLENSNIVLGDELNGIADAALGSLAERTTVFARVSRRIKTVFSSP